MRIEKNALLPRTCASLRVYVAFARSDPDRAVQLRPCAPEEVARAPNCTLHVAASGRVGCAPQWFGRGGLRCNPRELSVTAVAVHVAHAR